MDTRIIKTTRETVSIISGVTSHVASEECDLPDESQSWKTVHLPNKETMQTTAKTSLPFKLLTPKAREADVISHLQQSLMSVHKFLEGGYMKIFHPGNKGVTIHKPDTLNLTLDKTPIL
jgi:hypothetical protein